MGRAVTLFTGQWADLSLADLAKKAAGWGYDGLELACWGDHMDVFRAAEDQDYCRRQLAILEENNLKVFAISNHLAGQLVCDVLDPRHDMFLPKELQGGSVDPERKRQWAIDAMKNSARAAKNLGLKIVNGFTGSSIWQYIYSFPPASDKMIAAGFEDFADKWHPILDVFDECGVKFALEVHPTEIAFDIVTARRALEAIGNREAFGFNFDPSHLHWQLVDPVCFLNEFPDRIYHVHMKDAALQINGRNGILGSHLNFGRPERGWDFRSLGHGGVDFEEIIRTFNHIGYTGPLSVEWEDCGMERQHGAAEACEFVRRVDFSPSNVVFDEAFDR
jgi:sugar phosphate isomerase/epimerase